MDRLGECRNNFLPGDLVEGPVVVQVDVGIGNNQQSVSCCPSFHLHFENLASIFDIPKAPLHFKAHESGQRVQTGGRVQRLKSPVSRRRDQTTKTLGSKQPPESRHREVCPRVVLVQQVDGSAARASQIDEFGFGFPQRVHNGLGGDTRQWNDHDQ